MIDEVRLHATTVLLARSWDRDPAPVELPGDAFAAAAELLLASGAGALAWRRIRGGPLAATAAGQQLRDAYRQHAITAAAHEHVLKESLRLLREVGIDPILTKGWSVARLYPDPGLRPYGDVDLFVDSADRARAAAHLAAGEAQDWPVDLTHHDLPPEDAAGLFARSRVVPLDGVPVRVLAPEDQLRQLTTHQLRHALWRPLWLVDVAVLLESLEPGFDWDRALAGPRAVRDGVTCVAALAGRLLGARLDGTPLAGARLPRWLAPAVTAQWAGLTTHYYDGVPLAAHLGSPRRLLAAIRQRWPSPIQATVSRGAPFNDWPRWPFQVADCAIRLLRSIARLPSTRRALERRHNPCEPSMY